MGDFLATYLTHLFATGYWRERASGASGSMKKITRHQISLLEVPIPPHPIQRALAARLRAELAAAAELRASLEARLASLDRLPAALLRQVFG
jgi:restriction endonuclease S subunit